jgi:peptidoglycan/xylan/chitin deacetylase (PgdA/CDA1 family)
MQRRLALKIDVDTLRGTREGVPRLIELLQQHRAGATFLFSLGPDHTGRALRRAFRPGFMKKVSRTSVLEHYGLKTLLYGTLLPGPDIGRSAAPIMRDVAAAGFETGVHTWDHVRWQDGVAKADPDWTAHEMTRAVERYREIFGKAPLVHGAAGWQMNRHALRLTQRLGFALASDCRGTHPFIPVWDGEPVRCMQLPTTLPTLDEMIGIDGIDASNVAARLLELTAEDPRPVQVFTLHAELEGMKLAPVLDNLLAGWRAQGFELVSLGFIADRLNTASLPRHRVSMGSVPGRSGLLLVQGEAFLATPEAPPPGPEDVNPLFVRPRR